MAPGRPRKRVSTASAASTRSTRAATSKAVAVKGGSPARTPQRSPIKKRSTVTYAQKQAFIQNLQLEITERARKLRAQYALQAQALRTRLEMRINRIPHSLRKVNIMELIEKYSEQQQQQQKPVAPPKHLSPMYHKHAAQEASKATFHPRSPLPPVMVPAPNPAAARLRGTKRSSSELAQASDKENNDLNLPKKRAKAADASIAASATTTNAANTRATRTASRKGPATTTSVLSPRSHNSRTLPRSPLKNAPVLTSPQKPSAIASFASTTTTTTTTSRASPRPLSPSKPALAPPKPTTTAASARAPTRTVSRAAGPTPAPGAGRGKREAATATVPPTAARGGAGRGSRSRDSLTSNDSAGTTIVKRKPAATTTTKKTTAATKTTAAAAKRAEAAAKRKEDLVAGTAARKAAASASATTTTTGSGRTLRSRK